MTNTDRPYRHLVALQFKESTTRQQIDQIIQAFAKLQEQIPQIQAFEHGQQISPEGFDQGYTQLFMLTFKDTAAFQAYLPHPAHQAFVQELLPLIAPPPLVLDYIPA